MARFAQAEERLTILVVDDDPVVCDVLVQLLRSECCAVVQAAHATDSLTLLATTPCLSVVVTMPDYPERKAIARAVSLAEVGLMPVHALSASQAETVRVLGQLCPDGISISAQHLARAVRDDVLETLAAQRDIDRTRAHQYAEGEAASSMVE